MPLVSSNLLHAFVFVYKWLSGSPAAYSALLLNRVQCTCADNYAGFLLPIGISLRLWCCGDERHSPNSGKYLAAWQQDSVQGLEWNALTDWGNPLMGIRRSDSPGGRIQHSEDFIVAKLFNGADWKRGKTRLQLWVCIRKFVFMAPNEVSSLFI